MALRGPKESIATPGRVFAGLLVLAFLLSMIDSRGASGPLAIVRNIAVNVISPVQKVAFTMSQPVHEFFADWSQIGSKDEIIAQLRADNEELLRILAAEPDARRRAKELDELLNLAALGQYRVVLSRVMSVGATEGFGSTILIDAGAGDGIKKDMTVIAGRGMVGRVISTTNHTATVLLISDPTSTVGVRMAGTGQVGFMSGTGHVDILQMKFVDPTVKVKSGELLVTYGVAGGIFSPGIPVGEVVEVSGEPGTSAMIAMVKPFVSLGALDLVGVIVIKPRTDPRDSLLPNVQPVPTVTVTVTADPNATNAEVTQ